MPAHPQTRSFDLNIKRILEAWQVCHAVRELIANALDEQVLTGTKDIEIAQLNQRTWRIRDHGRGLKYHHFTQNENLEKLKYAGKVIGKFGVGLKDALATLHRHGVAVRIRSKFGAITLVQQPKHGFSDIQTLHAAIAPNHELGFAGTEIVLDGLAPNDMKQAKAFFLRFSDGEVLDETRFGTVLRKSPAREGRIYVTGLLVAEEENFLFSYNITSLTERMKHALNRERAHVGRTAYADRIKSMLLECRGSAVAGMLADELVKIEKGTHCDEVKWNDVAAHACKILNTGQKVLFVSASQIHNHADTIDHAKSDRIKIVPIPDSILRSIHGLRDTSGNRLRDISVYHAERIESFAFKFVDYDRLRTREKEVFDRRDIIAALVGGLPKAVRKVRISETMRPDSENGDHTEGLWDEGTASIIIRRDQLRSLPQFAGTLLHEIAHARSGCADVSRDFENELTGMLGTVAAQHGGVRDKTSILKRQAKPKRRSRRTR